MLEIDGSKKSGSGTILRLSISLAAITQEPLHIYNIRHKRRKPGLVIALDITYHDMKVLVMT